MATFRPLLVAWKVPGIRMNINTIYGGTAGNEGTHINCENLGTPLPAGHSSSRNKKPWSTVHGDSSNNNGSEEFIVRTERS